MVKKLRRNNTKILDREQKYQSVCGKDSKPRECLRNFLWFGTKYTKL